MEEESIICYHLGCADGIMSVYEFLRFIKPKYIIPCKVGEYPNISKVRIDKSQTTLYFLDICPPSLTDYSDFKEVIVCDHHPTAIEMVFNPTKPDNVMLYVDESRAGSQISSDYIRNKFNSELGRMWLTDYVSDRDRFVFELPFSKEISLSIFKTSIMHAIEMQFLNTKTIPTLEEETFEKHRDLGLQLLPMQDTEIEIACKTSVQKRIKIGSNYYNVWLCNSPINQSEIGAKLATRTLRDGSLPDFACLVRYDLRDEKWNVAIRGRKDGPDLNVIAGVLGGGGHPDAAKFILSYRDYDSLFNTHRRM